MFLFDVGVISLLKISNDHDVRFCGSAVAPLSFYTFDSFIHLQYVLLMQFFFLKHCLWLSGH